MAAPPTEATDNRRARGVAVSEGLGFVRAGSTDQLGAWSNHDYRWLERPYCDWRGRSSIRSSWSGAIGVRNAAPCRRCSKRDGSGDGGSARQSRQGAERNGGKGVPEFASAGQGRFTRCDRADRGRAAAAADSTASCVAAAGGLSLALGQMAAAIVGLVQNSEAADPNCSGINGRGGDTGVAGSCEWSGGIEYGPKANARGGCRDGEPSAFGACQQCVEYGRADPTRW